jgi:hypothetical protein
MSDKLRTILTLALRPETGDGEAVAALNAARRLTAKGGIDNIFNSVPDTKTVYKDRVVNRDRIIYRSVTDIGHREMSFKLTVPAIYHHTMVERIFSFAYASGIYIDVRKCKPKDAKIGNSTEFELTARGIEEDLIVFDKEIDRCIGVINDHLHKNNVTSATNTCANISKLEKKRGFFVKMIKKFAEAL